jgi:hypothetical protein
MRRVLLTVAVLLLAVPATASARTRLALLAGASAHSRACPHFRVGDDIEALSVRAVSCPTAEQIVHLWLKGNAVEHGSGPEADRSWTVDGWLCGHGAGGGACHRGSHALEYWIAGYWEYHSASAASAHKAHKPAHHPTTDPVTLAVKLAEQYWGATPCDGVITVDSSATVPTQLAGGTAGDAALEEGQVSDMWSTFAPSTSLPYTGCVTTLDSHIWPGWRKMDLAFQEFCDGITHEVGHFLGHEDTGQENPDSIEYPVLSLSNFNSVPQCRGITLWYGREPIRDPSEAELECEERRSAAAQRAGRDSFESCDTIGIE